MARRPKLIAKPILPVNNMAKAAAFYRSLGFDVADYDPSYAWVEEDGEEIMHLRYAEGLNVATNAASAYLHVQDADKWYARVTAVLGGKVAPVVNTPWQMREFTFADPSGNMIRVGQNI
jgi:predicted enzyme related to lactoylglutathione lyase